MPINSAVLLIGADRRLNKSLINILYGHAHKKMDNSYQKQEDHLERECGMIVNHSQIGEINIFDVSVSSIVKNKLQIALSVIINKLMKDHKDTKIVIATR